MVKTTSSLELIHGEFDIFHLKVTDVPAATPLTVELKAVGVSIVADPETTVHKPVPIDGLFPDNVKVPLAHCSMSVPASAVVGF